MYVAKLKGIALAVGAMTAVVSGAVVLAQPGPGHGPPQSRPSSVRLYDNDTAAEKAELPPTEAQRADALEKKLDRILEALERLPKPAPPFAGSAPGPPPAPTALEPVAVVAPGLPALPPPAAAPPALPSSPPNGTLAQRLDAVERQNQQMQQRLERLEKELRALDARVGGGEIHNRSRADSTPPPPSPGRS